MRRAQAVGPPGAGRQVETARRPQMGHGKGATRTQHSFKPSSLEWTQCQQDALGCEVREAVVPPCVGMVEEARAAAVRAAAVWLPVGPLAALVQVLVL